MAQVEVNQWTITASTDQTPQPSVRLNTSQEISSDSGKEPSPEETLRGSQQPAKTLWHHICSTVLQEDGWVQYALHSTAPGGKIHNSPTATVGDTIYNECSVSISRKGTWIPSDGDIVLKTLVNAKQFGLCFSWKIMAWTTEATELWPDSHQPHSQLVTSSMFHIPGDSGNSKDTTVHSNPHTNTHH